ncbi:uroporphyrinogen-III C-methyltransferase [Alteromonas gilva]|uniref:Uroporphyrinogen-III C-methyltransferase n=1 Tax=Alteromonas gilva TaxID=2987522 RepID=A0ABT5L4L2_9ALTE|nr:uroporphyrinogen-III C-methyltransferase [Alteromonas gilva]MDC8831974.1 uroporphyrinogen-III C-methyltransferase [Alteromonas gilva]
MADQQQPQSEQSKSLPSNTKAEPHSSASKRDTAPTHGAKPKEPGKPGGGGKTGLLWLVTLCNLALLGVGAYGGYWYFNQHSVTQSKLDTLRTDMTSQLAQKESQFNRQLQSFEQQVTQQAATTEQLAGNEQQQQQTLQQLDNQLQGALAQIQELDGRRPTDWLIAEADYLVRMAGRKIWLEQDVRTAIMLLGNADARLQSLADPSVLPVRALIAEDIQRLQQVNPVSQVSVALALDGLVKQVDNLAIITPKEENQLSRQEVSDSASDWQQNLLNVWHAIVDDFIRVEYRDTPVEPLMTAQQQWLSREQIKLALQQAQSAALASQQTLYLAAIERARTVVINDYVQNASTVTGFLKGLEQLQNTDISKEVPTELSSQAALEALLGSRVKRVFGEGASAL